MIPRNISKILNKTKKSVLLLGPRQTGKSTLMSSLKPDVTINLADEREFATFAASPGELFARLERMKPSLVLIDEVQRLPSLLNSIQVILDRPKDKPKFLLTGSSARKLRRGGANLLPGRVISCSLGPLVCSELDYGMDTTFALRHGTLPGIYLDESESDRELILRSYAANYLREEIQAEALTKNIEGFARFLNVIAACATEFLDLSKLASQAMVPAQTAKRFFEILEDTLIVQRVDAFAKTERKRLVQHPRILFFDCGVLNGLLGGFQLSADRVGRLFENLVGTQLHHAAASRTSNVRISSYRTEHGAEVDFIVETDDKVYAIECKASTNVGKSDLGGFASFAKFYKKPFRSIVCYLGDVERTVEGVDILPWQVVMKTIDSDGGR